jgi:CDP-diacylglycerol--serine O-phosphatidyltransferase
MKKPALLSGVFIGYYGFWVKLTYLSVISAVIGMFFALGGNIGHAIICLMICGLCDMFDGPVARLAKRTESEKSYGIQIDSLADMVSFGVFPVIIGYAAGTDGIISKAIGAFYILTAIIRLAYFNVVEIELQSKNEKRKYYEGLPVTFVALIIPLVYLACSYFDTALSAVYNIMLFVVSLAFIIRVKIPKLI